MTKHYDALICGGGLAGLTLARQLHREFPNMSVAVVEKTRRPLTDAAHKVGESTVELGSQYLERLGLREYLHERHLIKFGLRFFPGLGHLPIDQRAEIGPINQPIVDSYQIDRGRFETDLRAFLEEDGVTLYEGATVRDIELRADNAPHIVSFDIADHTETRSADWVIDATGRTGFLRNRLKLKRGGRHEANAGWFRVRGRVDITQMGGTSSRWRQVPESQNRWLSTNHLMGHGYWVWIIPLSTDATSIGVVTHEHVHSFDKVRTLENIKTFLAEHEPELAEFIAQAGVLDFRCIKRYCHTIARCWHPDRWAVIGEAGAFTDPLYSPGTDYIAFANAFTTELIRVAQDTPEQLGTRCQELNAQYRALVNGSIEIYRNAASVYNYADAMATKIYWDNHVYWSFPCQFFLQGIYRLSGDELQPFSELGARFVELSGRMQKVLQFWTEHYPASEETKPSEGELIVVPRFPSMLIDAHCALTQKMDTNEAFAYMTKQLDLAEELFSELLLRVTMHLGPLKGPLMWEQLEARKWEFQISPERIAAEQLTGRNRRRALPELTQDVERSLGTTAPRWSVADIAKWLGISEAEVA